MKKFTLGKNERLQKRYQFQRVFDQGHKYISPFFIVYVKEAKEKKVGFIVGSKLGKANQRNRAERILREIYRLNKHVLSRNLEMVIIAREKIIGEKFKTVQQEFKKVLEYEK